MVDKAMTHALGGLPPWLSRFSVDLTFSNEFEPQYSITTIQPLWQDPGARSTVFFQGRAASGAGEHTTNLGLGYRRLVWDQRMMLGANAFFDKEWDDNHTRASIGLEARSQPLDLSINYYEALSGRRLVDTTTYERALDGFDAELGVQVPYLPWAKVFARKSWWDGVDAQDIDSERLSVRLRPTPYLNVEAGRQWNDRQSPESFVTVGFNLALGPAYPGVGSAQRMVAQEPLAFTDMTAAVLEPVRRQNSIVVERTTAGATGSVVVARAN